jgi:hypothetical protein
MSASSYYMLGDTNVQPFVNNNVLQSGPISVTYNGYKYGPTQISITQSTVPLFHTNSALSPVTRYQVSGTDIGSGKSPDLVLDSGATGTTSLAVPSAVTGMYVLGWGGGGGGGGGGFEPGAGNAGSGGVGGASGAVAGYYQNINASGTLNYSVGGAGGGGQGAGSGVPGPNGEQGGSGGATTVNFVNTITINGGTGGPGGRDDAGGAESFGGFVTGNAPNSYGYRTPGSGGVQPGRGNTGGAGGSHTAFNLFNPAFPLQAGGLTYGAGGRGGNGDNGDGTAFNPGNSNGDDGSSGNAGRLIIWFYYDDVTR